MATTTSIFFVFLKALLIGAVVGSLMTLDWEGGQSHIPDATFNYGICLSASVMLGLYAMIRRGDWSWGKIASGWFMGFCVAFILHVAIFARANFK